MTDAAYHHRHAGATAAEGLSPGLLPPETGPLHIVGTHFYHADGTLAQIRDRSMFLLFLRDMRGEDITPDLLQMRAFGFNSARVFGLLPSPPWALPDYSRREHFSMVKFDGFLTKLEKYGIFCNFSIGHMPGDWKTFEQELDELARVHWCLLKEKVNEPHVADKPDPIKDFLPYKAGQQWVPPVAYGYYKELLDDKPGMPPYAAFGTVHGPRDSQWARKFRIAQEGQQGTGVPWWNNEGAKIVEPNFSYPGGKNDPKATPREAAWYVGGCYLWCSAGTHHDEFGKWGNFPPPGTLQYECCEQVRDNVFLRIDPTWQTGEFNRGGNHDSPVDNVYVEGKQEVWTYTSLHASKNRALSIRYGPIPLKAINGWRIVDAWGPKNAPQTFAILER